MPIWAFIVCIVAVVLLLVLLQLTGKDWAAGAMRVGIAAGIVALVVALAAVVRILLGMAAKSNPKRVFQLVSAGLAVLFLLSICLVGLTQQSTIHRLQAHFLEGQQQWQSSIDEYKLAGEVAPSSENLAQVYNEWGEQFITQQHIQSAIAKFDIVLTNFGFASTGVARAQSDTIKSYLVWGQQASQQQDYTSATNHFDTLLQLSYCTTACQSQANALDATAYYNLAESQLSTQNYTSATGNFQTVVTRFASSPEAQKLHGDYAKALLGQGKGLITTASCSSAIPIYQQLSSQFGDTPEGQQATSDLKAPQPVKGHFITAVPTNPALTPVAALMQGYNDKISNVQFYALLALSPTATIQRDGNFSFKPVKQGTYDLVWGTNNSNGNQLYYSVFHSVSLDFVVKVGPLCSFDFGDINEPIPQA
jgi:tetratricopeptide (TPR) repeat protein